MWVKKFGALLIFGIVLTMCLTGASAYPAVYFEMKDVMGDDYGYGTYQYPSNIAFQPYKGLFDILGFKVWSENPGILYFDTQFKKITNPWMAPEGFIHQNLRIYIDTQPNNGCIAPVKRGSNVLFHPDYGWEVCLKVVGWGNSQLITLEKGVLKLRSLKTEVLGDGQTIRATVPQDLLGIPAKSWNYYVVVGSYDGFGEDFFRKVTAKGGAWVFGGGFDENIEPNVIDILAPKQGVHSQEKQLKSFDLGARKLAMLYPAGLNQSRMGWTGWLGIVIGLLVLGGAGYLVAKRTKGISWFWVKRKKNGNLTV